MSFLILRLFRRIRFQGARPVHQREVVGSGRGIHGSLKQVALRIRVERFVVTVFITLRFLERFL